MWLTEMSNRRVAANCPFNDGPVLFCFCKYCSFFFNFLNTGSHLPLRKRQKRGTWVAQLVKCLTLDFGSGHDLTVGEFTTRVSSVLMVQSLLGIL